MIRSTKVSLKFTNTGKQELLGMFVEEYARVAREFIEILWPLREGHILGFLPKDMTSKVPTWLTARAIQAAGKQASGIVRGTVQKQKQREFVYQRLMKEGKFKHARRLKKVIDKQKISKPNLKTVNPELDSRFVKVGMNPETKEFEGWITLSGVGRKIKLELPFKGSAHLDELLERGTLKPGARLSVSRATLMFEVPNPPPAEGSVIGIDIGCKKVVSASTGFQTRDDPHGWNLDLIQKKLSRRKRGSEGFGKAQEHRTNYVNWSINQLNLKGVREIKVESLKRLRGKNRYLSHFTHAAIFGKLGKFCEDSGVQVSEVDPTYTSQRCSRCGWVRKGNRKGERFRCKSCGFEWDADLNAARNISLGLPAIGKQRRLRRENRKGFYWNAPCQEPIVPDAQKSGFLVFQ